MVTIVNMKTTSEAFERAVQVAGGAAALARLLDEQLQIVCNWRKRGIPEDRMPQIERALNGRVTCEQLSPPGLRWARVKDPTWLWNKRGRPVRDVTRDARRALPA